MSGHTPARVGSSLETRGSARAEPGYWRRSSRRLFEDRAGLVAGLVLLTMIVAALAAPQLSALLTGYSPTQQDFDRLLATPNAAHPFGTDQLGRDILTRLLYGAQVSLSVAALTTVMAVGLGMLIGLIAGHYGGWADTLLMRLVDTLLAIPPLFVYIMLSITLRPDTLSLAAVIAAFGWLPVARLVRAEALVVKHLDYVLAARAIGATNPRVIFRYVLPAVIPVMVIAASVCVGATILTEAALGYLGMGIQPPAPTWGNMIADGQRFVARTMYPVLFPGIAIFVTVLAVNVFGNAARDALDPRLV